MQNNITPVKASAREVFELITKGSSQVELDRAINEVLRCQFGNARHYQEAKGRRFEVEFEDFLKVVTPSRRKTMAKKMQTGNFARFMESNYGYVITWRDRAAFKSGVLNKDTIAYLNRVDAKRAAQFTHGDKHSAESIERIRAARTGTTHSEQTRELISASKKGQEVSEETRSKISAATKDKPKTEEQKQKMREAAIARHARNRAAKGETPCPIKQSEVEKSAKPNEAESELKKNVALSAKDFEAIMYPTKRVPKCQLQNEASPQALKVAAIAMRLAQLSVQHVGEQSQLKRQKEKSQKASEYAIKEAAL